MMRTQALASLILALVGWASYLPLSKHLAYRATLWPMWSLLALAAVLGVAALRGKEQATWFNRGIACAGLLLALLAIPAFLLIFRVPGEAGRPQAGQPLPYIRVISEFQDEGLSSQAFAGNSPLLLVFFRGFW